MGRRSKKIELVRTMLIITEGSTEKLYFDSLRECLRIPGLTIVPREAKHSSLNDILKNALASYDEDAYESVWVVFDRDTQSHYSEKTRTLIAKAKRKGILFADSMPCFEIWILAHFCLPQAYYHTQEQVEDQLKRHIPGYAKEIDWHKRHSLYRELLPSLKNAITHGKALTAKAENDIQKTNTLVWKIIENIQQKRSCSG
ncbi:hypothetical protein SpiGrapes_1615 [Sphaerochaeta pleomorpha str. Grapes]|uniref:RloB-like protein n=1 Tax=Sphaerochaeta pleomorpha (strain ATCC BAA-1885 / DSM 22778 / Grapes) TaxID=158190 RepID=G8QWC4_SPHPG|nr:RloB family protein [Sphaerochaeta pleomorpha]AEV29422.1 hypothetical protein SpiGrapes_1615 [Sphaerochaeta pleomorpha str. Grapes]